MANIMYGGGVTQIAGKMGGNVFARNAGGDYIRSNKKPVNPRSSRQSVRRANMAYITKHWSSVSSEQERADWRAYAAGTGWQNKLGQAIEINGLAAFLRLNTLFAFAGAGVHAAAPTAMGHAGGVTYTFAAESDTGKIQMNEPGGAFDKDVGNNNLLVFMGLPSEAGRLAKPKGFRYLTWIQGSVGDPPAFPLEIQGAYTMAEGQLITLRTMFLDEEFRVSGPHWGTVIAGPAA